MITAGNSRLRTTDKLAKLTRPLSPRRPTKRQLDIDAARGIAILLVVIGHIGALHSKKPLDNEWYFTLRWLIYDFHMPLFMALTGISFALSLPHFSTYTDVFSYARSKTTRLVVPYLFFGFLVLFGKLVAAHFMHVDNQPKGTLDDVIAIFVYPTDSVAGFLWFIYVLGLYFLMLPAFLQATGRRPFILFILSILAVLIHWPPEFMIDDAFAYLPYFTAGMLLWLYREHWERVNRSITVVFVLAFAVALTLAIPLNLSKWFVGAFSIPAVLSLVQYIPHRQQRTLAWLGQLSFSIYLMNTLAIGIVKALMFKIFSWDGKYFLIYFPVLILAGALIPIMIKKTVSRRLPSLDRFL